MLPLGIRPSPLNSMSPADTTHVATLRKKRGGKALCDPERLKDGKIPSITMEEHKKDLKFKNLVIKRLDLFTCEACEQNRLMSLSISTMFLVFCATVQLTFGGGGRKRKKAGGRFFK